MKNLFVAALAAAFLLLAAPDAHAQGNVSFGAHGAYDLDAEAFGVGGQVRLGANLGGYALVFNPNAEYYFVDDAENVDVSLIAVGIDLLYEIGDQYVSAFQPYFGAGLGIRRASADVDVPGGNLESSDTELGLNLIGGAKFGVGSPVTPFVQATLTIMDGTPVGLKAGILFGGR